MYLIEDETEIARHSSPLNCAVTVPTVPQPIETPEAFKQAFKLVMAQYQCSQEERRAAKRVAAADWENAVLCYAAIEREILGPAQGINERIRDAIAKKDGLNGNDQHENEFPGSNR